VILIVMVKISELKLEGYSITMLQEVGIEKQGSNEDSESNDNDRFIRTMRW
jgi:hypothetical protein